MLEHRAVRPALLRVLLQARWQPVPELRKRFDEAAIKDNHEDLRKVRDHMQYLLRRLPNSGSTKPREQVHPHEMQQRAVRPGAEPETPS